MRREAEVGTVNAYYACAPFTCFQLLWTNKLAQMSAKSSGLLKRNYIVDIPRGGLSGIRNPSHALQKHCAAIITNSPRIEA